MTWIRRRRLTRSSMIPGWNRKKSCRRQLRMTVMKRTWVMNIRYRFTRLTANQRSRRSSLLSESCSGWRDAVVRTSFSVHKATQKTHWPSFRDWNFSKRILRYLKGSKALKLHIVAEPRNGAKFNLQTFSGADFASDKIYRNSLTGAIVMLPGIIDS